MYQRACAVSVSLSDATLGEDTLTPEGFSASLQAHRPHQSPPSMLRQVPRISEYEQLRHIVSERWNVFRPVVEAALLKLSGDSERKNFLVLLSARVAELLDYRDEQRMQAAWIAMDFIQAHMGVKTLSRTSSAPHLV